MFWGWIILIFVILLSIGSAIDKLGKRYTQHFIYEEHIKSIPKDYTYSECKYLL